MIIVNIFNGMETELTSNEGPVSENVKIFRHYCYAKMCNLIGMSNITTEYVTSLTMPYFECTYIEVTGQGFAELHFERYTPKKEEHLEEAEPVVEQPAPADEDAERLERSKPLIDSINEVVDKLSAEDEKKEPVAPAPKKRGRPKKNA